jgi:hypothetical protein
MYKQSAPIRQYHTYRGVAEILVQIYSVLTFSILQVIGNLISLVVLRNDKVST